VQRLTNIHLNDDRMSLCGGWQHREHSLLSLCI
jgi:hypothetical protein